MRSNGAHITGWLVIVLVTVAFIGEAYGSPTGAFHRWEQSRLVQRGDGVGADSWGEVASRQTGSRGAGDVPAGARSGRRGEYLEEVIRLDDARPVAWEHEGESIAIDPEAGGRDAERELSAAGIWEDRDSEHEAFLGRAGDEHGDDRGAWGR